MFGSREFRFPSRPGLKHLVTGVAILCLLALFAVAMNPQSIDIEEKAGAPPKPGFPPHSKELAEYILNVALRRGSPLIWSRRVEDKSEVVAKTPTPPVMAKPGQTE